MSEQIKGLVFHGCHKPKPLELMTFSKPAINPGQIWTKILLCTICGSDVHTLCGKRNEPIPSILGHEAVGMVIECAREDCPCKPGDRITFCIMNSCQTCEMCTAGYPQKCHTLSKYGHLPLSHKSGLTGCYATQILLDVNTQVYVVPQHLPDSVVAPINCSLATMVNATRHIPRSQHYRSALIQGAGLLGLYGSLLLKEEHGFTKVLCSDINSDRLAVSSQFGAQPITAKEVANNSVDVVIEVCGHPSVINEGIRCLRVGGLYILVGLVHPNSQLDITGEQIIRKCLTITGVHNYRPVDLGFAVDFLSKIYDKYPFDQLTSPEYTLHNAEEAFECAKQQKYIRVAIRPE